ncbi:DedA family protein [Halomonas sp. TRM85114]|nr:DedA family protein [Halomonas jincaotanensis]
MSRSSSFSAQVWLDRLDRSRHAMVMLFGLSMMETLLLPIPIELILIPWMLCHPHRKWTMASVALMGNLTAATLGYYLGVSAMAQWGDTLILFFGSDAAYENAISRIQQDGFLAILTVGLSPVPFQLAMLAAGASGYPFLLFLLAAMLARGARYFGLAILVKITGEAALSFWRKHSTQLGLVGLVLFGVWLWFTMMV